MIGTVCSVTQPRFTLPCSGDEAGSGETSGLLVSAEKGSGLDELKELIQTSLLAATDLLPRQLRIPMSGAHLR